MNKIVELSCLTIKECTWEPGSEWWQVPQLLLKGIQLS